MSKEKTHINIEVKIDDIRAGLQKLIRSDYSSLIAETIVTHLSITEEGLKQVYLAMSGVKVCAKFKVLDKVLVKSDTLPSWRMDLDKTKEAGYSVKGLVKGNIQDIDMTQSSAYQIYYKYLNSAGEEHIDTIWINEKYIELAPSSNDTI